MDDAKYELNKEDLERVHKSAQVKVDLEKVLESVVPSLGEDQVDALSHDLADVLDVLHKHAERVQNILQLKGEQDRQQLDDFLSDLLYGDITELEYHIDSLKNTLPEILRQLG